MTTYHWYLILHLVGVFLLVGGAGISTATGVLAGRRNDPKLVEELLGLQIRTERVVTLPGAAIVLAFGLLLVNEVGFSYTAGWLIAAYVLFALTLALDFHGLVPFSRRVRKQAQELSDQGVTESDELRRAAGAPAGAVMGAVLDLVLLAFLYLMVVKPGA